MARNINTISTVCEIAFPCQEAESHMQKIPAMPGETLGNSPSIIVCFSSMNPYFKHISTQKRAPRSSVFRGTLQICLGERLNGIQEVSGSIPLISTRKGLETVRFQGFFFFSAPLFLIIMRRGCSKIKKRNGIYLYFVPPFRAAQNIMRILPLSAILLQALRVSFMRG